MANSVRVHFARCAQGRPLRPELQRISLARSEVLVLSDVACQGQILCDTGLLWITQDGDPEDHMVKRGERFTVTQPGRVVILACGT